MVSAEADLSFLWEAIGKIRFGTAGYAYLVDERGNLIAHKDAALVLKQMNLQRVDGVRKFLRNPTRSDLTPADEGRGLTNSPVLVTYAPVPELGWSVILEEPLDVALANVEILKRSLTLTRRPPTKRCTLLRCSSCVRLRALRILRMLMRQLLIWPSAKWRLPRASYLTRL